MATEQAGTGTSSSLCPGYVPEEVVLAAVDAEQQGGGKMGGKGRQQGS